MTITLRNLNEKTLFMTGFFPFVRSLAKLTPTLKIVEESKMKYKYGTELLDEVRSDLRSKGLPKKKFFYSLFVCLYVQSLSRALKLQIFCQDVKHAYYFEYFGLRMFLDHKLCRE